VSLINIEDIGLRPVVDKSVCRECGDCIKVCPGVGLEHGPYSAEAIPELCQSWGPILELWEGYAADEKIHHKGSSGGAATALALYCLESRVAGGVVHIAADPQNPLVNVPVFSRTMGELLRATGSRYSPAAPCLAFGWIESADSPCVFIGKPCDVAALRKAQRLNSRLAEKVALAISIFCAGTPSANGTHEILDVLGVRLNQVIELRYRGCGWPGFTTAVDVKGNEYQMTYEQSWGNILTKYVQPRCRFCADSTGEFADVSCGDPWYKKPSVACEGSSLMLLRTERGLKHGCDALKGDYIIAHPVRSETLPLSQGPLLRRRRHLWGRFLALHMIFLPTPRFRGFSLLENWLRLSMWQMVLSVASTLKRAIIRKWNKPQRIKEAK
jgi:coenzyme F420 hydrogenase subunit beta